MMIHEITERVGRHKKPKRLGRGDSSGRGGTSGKGHKGALSRAGWSSRPAYAGGATPFARRFPKRGFSNADFRNLFHIINLKAIEAGFESGETVDAESLVKKGLIRDARLPVKVLAEGDLSLKVTVVAARFSAQAKAKIEQAGGSVREVPLPDPAAAWKAKRGSRKNDGASTGKNSGASARKTRAAAKSKKESAS